MEFIMLLICFFLLSDKSNVLFFSPFVSCTSRVFVAHEIVSFDLKAQVIVDATNFRLSLFIFAKWKRKTANTLTKRITDYYRSDTMSMSLFFSCQWKYGLAIVLWTAEGVRVHKGRGTREIWEQRKSFSSLKPCNFRWTAKKILLMNGIREKDHTVWSMFARNPINSNITEVNLCKYVTSLISSAWFYKQPTTNDFYASLFRT